MRTVAAMLLQRFLFNEQLSHAAAGELARLRPRSLASSLRPCVSCAPAPRPSSLSLVVARALSSGEASGSGSDGAPTVQKAPPKVFNVRPITKGRLAAVRGAGVTLWQAAAAKECAH